MNTVADLHAALNDEMRRLQPPAGLETRVLQRALADTAAIHSVPRFVRSGRIRRRDANPVQAPRLMALVAAVLAIAIVLSFAFAAHALRPSPIPVRPGPLGGVQTTQPIPVKAPAVLDCPANCVTGTLTPASPNVVWAIVEPSAPGSANIYRSADGAHSWYAQASWNNSEPAAAINDITVSSDGKEALFVDVVDSTMFHTGDAGAHWASFGIPLTVAPQDAFQTYFLNPRVGWLVSPDLEPRTDDVFHTTDSGAHWVLTGRVATAPAFDLMHGRLLFESSSAGWFVPEYTGNPLIAQTVYRTTDGGRSWRPLTLEALPATPREIKPGVFAPVQAQIADLKFFNDTAGVIELQGVGVCGQGPDGQQFFCIDPGGPMAVYTTSDGGATWSAPRSLPGSAAIDFIDATHWVESSFIGGGFSLNRTSDGGASWVNIASVVDNGPAPALGQLLFQSVQFVDPSNGFARVQCGDLIRTHDGGAHWEVLSLPSQQPIRYGRCTL